MRPNRLHLGAWQASLEGKIILLSTWLTTLGTPILSSSTKPGSLMWAMKFSKPTSLGIKKRRSRLSGKVWPMELKTTSRWFSMLGTFFQKWMNFWRGSLSGNLPLFSGAQKRWIKIGSGARSPKWRTRTILERKGLSSLGTNLPYTFLFLRMSHSRRSAGCRAPKLTLEESQ